MPLASFTFFPPLLSTSSSSFLSLHPSFLYICGFPLLPHFSDLRRILRTPQTDSSPGGDTSFTTIDGIRQDRSFFSRSLGNFKMDEKIRPGYVPPVAQTVGVSPNPAAAGISWPMSFPTPTASYERSAISSMRAPISEKSTGTRYDPVRHTDYFEAVPKAYSPIDSFSGVQKRKRDDDMGPSLGHEENSRNDISQDYQYEPQKIVTPTNSLQSGKRNHVCDICGATFTRQHNLKSHFLTHTSSKKEFICSECGSEFRRSHDLKRHQKLHTGEKPFACHTCGRRFARADALGRHAKSSGEGGCVNSRKTSSDQGSANITGYQFPSPPAGTQDDASYMNEGHRSRTNSLHISTATFGDQSSGSEQTSPKDSVPSMSRNSIPQDLNPRPITDPNLMQQDQTTLPPLQAALGLENERYYESHSAPQESYLAPPRFGGISSAAFEPRPPSTHPLSFDRGPGAAEVDHGPHVMPPVPPSDPAMVPLQRYQQLEAEHREAMERIKRFEMSKKDRPAGSEGFSSTRDESRPQDRGSLT